jgi:acetyltransferase-like isoleucine patch superfamily enzyme
MIRAWLRRLWYSRGSYFLRDDRRYRKYQIGDYTYGRPEIFQWGEGASLSIGRFCSIATGAKILLGGNHRVDWPTTYPFPKFFLQYANIAEISLSKGNVSIGNDVWIGMDAMVLSGVTIGDGAVIAARAVCTKDVPPYAIVAGNPGRIVRYRFEDDIIAALLRIRWWDWPIQDLQNAIPLLMQTDIGKFIEWCEQNGHY